MTYTIEKLDKALERGVIDVATHALEMEKIKAASPAVETEAITIGFRTKESDGSIVLSLDGFSDSAVEGGYDALRSANLARANDDKEGESKALDIVAACSDRAKQVGKHLVHRAADKAAECMKPGGKASDRAKMRVMLKGVLKAYRVSAKRK